MQGDSKAPFSVALCIWMIRLAAQLVPAAQRGPWIQEWTAEIWHRWQFLLYAGAWGRLEAFHLCRNCAGAFRDAAWHLISRETLRQRVRDAVRSPWTCLVGLLGLLLVIGMTSGGFAATRQLITFPSQQSGRHLLFIWLHPIVGGGDRGLPPDVVPDWARHSQLLENVAGFNISKAQLTGPHATAAKPLIVVGDQRLFDTLQVHPALGKLPGATGANIERAQRAPNALCAVLDHEAWVSLFHADKYVIGSQVRIGEPCVGAHNGPQSPCAQAYRVSAVLPANFHFLSREPTVYVIQREMTDRRVMTVARARAGARTEEIDRELVRIAEGFSYYFFRSQLRFGFIESVLFTPLVSFGLAVLVAGLITLALCGIRVRRIRSALKPENRRVAMRRAAFFVAKLSIALAVLFIAGLEWSRSPSSLLFGSRDPGSGPVLLWLYIAGAMGVFFLCVADQRARCRVCLRLLCFPVRIGCPGCLLLDWSGTELLCTEGHGVLHVPLLAPSWDEEHEHWIALDESWQDLFAQSK